mmetsp:Transcript_40382/g.105227  ORF Transcript_40382/g.105227 Transcript_40382/m.105227 type:complete len:336 (+) Transcript_40382:111-1118(+)
MAIELLLLLTQDGCSGGSDRRPSRPPWSRRARPVARAGPVARARPAEGCRPWKLLPRPPCRGRLPVGRQADLLACLDGRAGKERRPGERRGQGHRRPLRGRDEPVPHVVRAALLYARGVPLHLQAAQCGKGDVDGGDAVLRQELLQGHGRAEGCDQADRHPAGHVQRGESRTGSQQRQNCNLRDCADPADCRSLCGAGCHQCSSAYFHVALGAQRSHQLLGVLCAMIPPWVSDVESNAVANALETAPHAVLGRHAIERILHVRLELLQAPDGCAANSDGSLIGNFLRQVLEPPDKLLPVQIDVGAVASEAPEEVEDLRHHQRRCVVSAGPFLVEA